MRTSSEPREEFGDGAAGEDGRGVSMGDAEDIGPDVFVGDDRDEALKGVGIWSGAAGQAVPVQVLGRGVLRQDLGKHAALYLVRVGGHIFDEFEGLAVLIWNGSRREYGLWCLWHGGGRAEARASF